MFKYVKDSKNSTLKLSQEFFSDFYIIRNNTKICTEAQRLRLLKMESAKFHVLLNSGPLCEAINSCIYSLIKKIAQNIGVQAAIRSLNVVKTLVKMSNVVATSFAHYFTTVAINKMGRCACFHYRLKTLCK